MVEESGFQVGRDAPRFYEAESSRFMRPFVDALIRACVRRGDAVLDIACGTGFATRAAAIAAGPGTRIEGADINPAMIQHATTVAHEAELDIGWCETSALDLPHSDDEYDVVICQQGIQFFPDPAAAVREMVRVTRPGGRVGITAWAPPANDSFLHLEAEMLADATGEPQPGFSATAEQLNSWAFEGGLSNPSTEMLVIDVDLPPIWEYVPRHLKALPWSASFFALPDDAREAALTELERRLQALKTPTGITTPFRSYLLTATT